jgi:hypothetical protein
MTAKVQPETKSPSRRALLAGALGGIGALAAQAIGRATPVRAANGDAVTVGGSFSGTGATTITTTGAAAYYGISSNTGADALKGVATATSGSAYGVNGQSGSDGGIGVLGFAYAATGMAKGIWGESASPAGVGVYAANFSPGGGVALQAAGRTKLSTSGVATVTAGHATKVVTPGVNVTSSSFVLLTPKVKLSGRDLWFTTDASGNKFTIHMSSSRSSGTKVAWLLLG